MNPFALLSQFYSGLCALEMLIMATYWALMSNSIDSHCSSIKDEIMNYNNTVDKTGVRTLNSCNINKIC